MTIPNHTEISRDSAQPLKSHRHPERRRRSSSPLHSPDAIYKFRVNSREHAVTSGETCDSQRQLHHRASSASLFADKKRRASASHKRSKPPLSPSATAHRRIFTDNTMHGVILQRSSTLSDASSKKASSVRPSASVQSGQADFGASSSLSLDSSGSSSMHNMILSESRFLPSTSSPPISARTSPPPQSPSSSRRAIPVPRFPRMDAIEAYAAARRRRKGADPWSDDDDDVIAQDESLRSEITFPLSTKERPSLEGSSSDNQSKRSLPLSIVDVPPISSKNVGTSTPTSDSQSLNSSVASTSDLASRRNAKTGSPRSLPRLEARNDRLTTSLRSATTPRDPLFESSRRGRSLDEDSMDDSFDSHNNSFATKEALVSLGDVLRESVEVPMTPRSAILPASTVIRSENARDSILGLGKVKEFRRRSATAAYPTSSASSSPPSPKSTRPTYSLRSRSKSQNGVWLQEVLVWDRLPESVLPLPAHKERTGVLSKAPLIRDVPAAVRKRVAKRDSTQMLSTSASSPSFASFSSDVKGKKRDPLNESFSYGSKGPNSHIYGWRVADCAIHRSGLLTITTVDDHIPIHSIPVSLLVTTDISPVDPSVFGRNHCISLRTTQTRPFRHKEDTLKPQSNNRINSRQYFSTPFNHHQHSDFLDNSTDDRVYLSLPNGATAKATLALLKAHASPVILRPIISSNGDNDSGDNKIAETTTNGAVRVSRSLDLTVTDIFLDNLMTPRPDPRLRFAAHRSTSVEDRTNALYTQSTPAARTSQHSRDKQDKGKGDISVQDLFVEVYMDGNIVGRSKPSPKTVTTFFRADFTWHELPITTSTVTIKVFGATSHKPSLEVTSLGSVDIPLQTFKRGQHVEHWYPITDRYGQGLLGHIKGEINVRIRLNDTASLPVSNYKAVQEAFCGHGQPDLSYFVIAKLHRHSEAVSEIMLRIAHETGLLPQRLLDMADVEVDGDASGANILFRGNSLLTKSMELYMRLIGSSFLQASIGEAVACLCADQVELEINPEKLAQSPNERTLAVNIRDLQHWTSHMWNSLYQARHRCPVELRKVFKHIQVLVEERYENTVVESARYTSVSAFIFLRFFVPALLNPRLFGLVQAQIRPAVQRTLTLIAKTLQGLANMTNFGAKEPYMSVMNEFVDENKQAFVDYVYSISKVDDTAALATTEEAQAAEGAKEAALVRNKIQEEIARDAVPSLPYLFDLGKEYAMLCSYMARDGATMDKRNPELHEDPNFKAFTKVCVDAHAQAQECFAAVMDQQQDLAQVFGVAQNSRASLDERVEYITLDSVNGSPGNISLKHVTGRNRAHTVSASVHSPPRSLRRTPSGDLVQRDAGKSLAEFQSQSPKASGRSNGNLFGTPESVRSLRALGRASGEDDVSVTSSDNGSDSLNNGASTKLRRMFKSSV